uniref:Immunoglobulin V-set domain-containing protein n=1 Tax=Erpetoichthys calabaricus TaxID=27687 RepID=A0A8C4T350_ERPCA
MSCNVAFFYVTGLEALVLTQEKRIFVNPGQAVRISCAPSTGTWSITWYQQKTGSAPRYLLYDSNRASGLPARFRASEENSGRMEYLKPVISQINFLKFFFRVLLLLLQKAFPVILRPQYLNWQLQDKITRD